MADGFDIHLNEEQAQRLKLVAEAAGVDPAVYAVQVVEEAIEAGGSIGLQEYPAHWVQEDEERWVEYERTGETVPLEDALRDFHAHLAKRLAEKA